MHTRKRLRLRDWLVNMINSGSFSGLQWEDPKEKVFRVPWKHGSRHGWTVEDASLFRAWAVYTGKFKEGKDKPDPRKWKTNFRCALNALPDIREIRTRSCPRGKDAFKVYQMKSSLKYRDNSSQANRRQFRETVAKGKSYPQASLAETLSMNQALPAHAFLPIDATCEYWPNQETKNLNDYDYEIVEIVDKILCDAGSPFDSGPSSASLYGSFHGDPGVNPLFPFAYGGDPRSIC